jgi:hypothetical protein
MLRWSRSPEFLDRDASFIGPLESGATLGISRCFSVYKPASEYASFLEVRHDGDRYVRGFSFQRLRRETRFEGASKLV